MPCAVGGMGGDFLEAALHNFNNATFRGWAARCAGGESHAHDILMPGFAGQRSGDIHIARAGKFQLAVSVVFALGNRRMA